MRTLIVATGIICLAAGFVAGKLTQSTPSIQNPITINTEHQELNLDIPKLVESKSIPAIASAKDPVKDCAPTNHNTATITNKEGVIPAAVSNKTPEQNYQDTSNKPKLKFTTTTEISDESIDELVPKPFNTSVKHLQSDLKAKFANYLQAENQNDSEVQAEHFLNDSLNRGQLSGIAEINFIGCKAGLCEIRLFEQAPNQTMPTIVKQLAPYRDYFQDASSSMTSDGQRTYIHYLMNIKH